ncbi:nucleotidyl transferase AbiEii/AbiGii toxin family protein [Salinibacterium sp. SWN248]|uniref:nucleotidyl transferase AbiEii/AbiGii toxin family protein n=1 Tax=Salinibacterium sp. SWN248 TaxID=2792056 RepID=UPI0018CF0B50|nr:nucleotidyl transferase AbiEii/AbiGii toxin family protein [Salinibacterium sp. SWN248]MBH0022603.1 nucleotidyl transferase AbiEii/AbiGii toxin family protein [Salinibacterium sp. SWN248]
MKSTFEGLPPRDALPKNTAALNSFLNAAAKKTDQAVDRLGWLAGSVIVMAVLQRALGADGRPEFLIKGGAYLEHRLEIGARATKDVDTVYRGAIADFESALDSVLAEPWEPFELTRTEIETVENARTTNKPRRFHIQLKIRGQVFRKIKVEVSFSEGKIGEGDERFTAPDLSALDLGIPDEIAGITMAYQVAQKLHACTDPDDPTPEGGGKPFFNDRVRDVVDLLLLRDAFFPAGSELSTVKAAAEDVFEARAAEAEKLGFTPRRWPPEITTWKSWAEGWQKPADQAAIKASLEEALATLNEWVKEIEQAAAR